MSGRRIACMLFFSVVCLTALGVAGSGDTQAEPTVVYLVRHAEKVSESGTSDLSDEGHARAKVLAWMLSDVSFDTIYSTNTARTKNTVKPTADAKGLKISPCPPRPGQLSRVIMEESRGKTLLVCGHSNTIPSLLQELGAGIEEELLEGYDDLFIVVLHHKKDKSQPVATLQRLHYSSKW